MNIELETNLIDNEVISREPDIDIDLKDDEYVLENTTREWGKGYKKIDDWHYVILKKLNETSYLLKRV